MVSLENFKSTLNLISDLDTNYEKLKNVGIDILESWLMDIPNQLFDNWVTSHFTQEGADVISWWIYESVDKMITINESELDLSDIENLYHYLLTNNFML